MASISTSTVCLLRLRSASALVNHRMASVRALSTSSVSSTRSHRCPLMLRVQPAVTSSLTSWPASPLTWSCSTRPMSSDSKLTRADVQERVIKVCKVFDRINADKLTLDSHFIKDLGLDSLDHVEVIMAIEDEFGFEIPDDHAERLMTPAKLVDYVADHEDVD